MRKIYLFLVILMGISVSCTKDFEDYNTDKKHPTEVPGGYLFANAQKALGDQIASTNVNLNIWKLWSQYWTETTYTDEANYDIINRNIAGNTFRVYYRDILRDLKEARMYIEAEPASGEEQLAIKANRLYIIDAVEAYCYSNLLDIFGNIPYSEALDIDNYQPKYDDALAVYSDLLLKLEAAANGLNSGFGSFDSDDLFFGGDVAMWIKFVNTLRIRIAITIADAPGSVNVKSIVESAYNGSFAYGDLCQLNYPGGTMSNPLYQDLVQSGRHDFVAANTLIDVMNSLQDPRLPAYFTMVGDTVYVGGNYGESSAFSQFSHIADPIQAENFPITILDYTELAFYLAEAAERQMNVGGTAEEYYNLAVSSSFDFWGIDGAVEYLLKPEVAYSTAAGSWKQKIGTQAWLAYYLRGLTSYTSWRRLDFPILNLAPTITDYNQIPVRFTYPVAEQTLNATNYYQAASAIGGDMLTTKLFWDKY